MLDGLEVGTDRRGGIAGEGEGGTSVEDTSSVAMSTVNSLYDKFQVICFRNMMEQWLTLFWSIAAGKRSESSSLRWRPGIQATRFLSAISLVCDTNPAKSGTSRRRLLFEQKDIAFVLQVSHLSTHIDATHVQTVRKPSKTSLTLDEKEDVQQMKLSYEIRYLLTI